VAAPLLALSVCLTACSTRDRTGHQKGRNSLERDDAIEDRPRHRTRSGDEHVHPRSPGDKATWTPRPPARRPEDVRAAFSRFYRDYAPRLVAYLLYLGASREEAAECAQEALIKALHHWASITDPKAWCRKTAAREYGKRRFSTEEPFDEVPANGEPLVSPDKDFEDFEQRHHILAMMRQLPPKQRQVMTLTFEGATPAEIASDHGLTSQQVRSNLRLARRRLAILLEEARQGEENQR
jgi:RNA polymerase sigma-70 factor (ECF subfamily)